MPFRNTPTAKGNCSPRLATCRNLLRISKPTIPRLRTHLRGEDGQVRRFINFYVNEEDIRFLGNDAYAFQDGDEVLVIPSIAGVSPPGCCCSYCGREECLCE